MGDHHKIAHLRVSNEAHTMEEKMELKQAVKKVWNVTYMIDKETPGTMRYQQVDERGVPVSNIMPGCVAPTIYIRKSAFKGSQPPTRLTVTISGE